MRPPALPSFLPRRNGSGHGILSESRHHLIAIGDKPHGRGHFRGSFLHVIGNDALVRIKVSVVSHAVVFDGVLAEADSGQPGIVV